MDLVPTEDEVRQWLLHTVRHVCHIEYFLHELGLGQNDPERPHDIVGEGNKFEWEVVRGFAVQHRERTTEFFQANVMPALTRHRCQYHHRKWNEPVDDATPEDMKLGAVDAICSLLESRAYQGGVHTFEQILEVTEKNPPHKRPWMRELVPEMRILAAPPVELITALNDIPNIGIPNHLHDIVRQRVDETRRLLKSDHGYAI